MYPGCPGSLPFPEWIPDTPLSRLFQTATGHNNQETTADRGRELHPILPSAWCYLRDLLNVSVDLKKMLFRVPGSLYYHLFPLLRNSDSVVIFLWDLKLFLKRFSFSFFSLYPLSPDCHSDRKERSNLEYTQWSQISYGVGRFLATQAAFGPINYPRLLNWHPLPVAYISCLLQPRVLLQSIL